MKLMFQLKHGLSGYWSRRINDEHRTVYKHQDDTKYIIATHFKFNLDNL